MKIVVNGENQEVSAGITLAELLVQLDQPNGVAVAVNLEFVPRPSYPTRKLSESDEVEIVAPIAGG